MKRLNLVIVLLLLAALPAHAQYNRRGWGDDYKQFRIALNGGYSYRLAKVASGIDPAYRSYFEKLKQGYHFGGNAAFFFNDKYGAGVQFSSMRASNQMTGITAQNALTGQVATGNMSDYVVINFIGPSFNTRYIFGANDNLNFLASVALGYITYKDDAALITPYVLKGNTLGTSMNIGFDIGLSESIYMGIEIAYLGGIIDKMEFSDGTTSKSIELKEEEREGLSRVDVSGGIRFNF